VCTIEAMLAFIFMVFPMLRWISGLLFAFCTVVLLSMMLVAVAGTPDARKVPEAKLKVSYGRWFNNLKS
jgi:membrane protein required for beta-lactamase induction